MKKIKILVIVVLFLSFSLYADKPEVVARQVINRIANQTLQNIELVIDSELKGNDTYQTQCINGQLEIKGSSVIALCRGFYDYLRNNELGMVGWEGATLRIPKVWPDSALNKVQSPFKIRHCYNVVTSGYTTPYWTWERWEQELDWLAVHGFNMIMAPIATEAIMSRVWKGLGLNQEEIDDFVVGPAHLPWMRMGNIKSVGGSLSDEWHADQIILQKKVLGRMRELGIEPIVQGFSGFVPDALCDDFPEINFKDTLWNSGFPKSQRPKLLLPDNDLFATISKTYIQEWKREFGFAKYYLVDSFNELKNIKSDPKLFEKIGKKTYDAVIAGDPNGIWVIQGWMFSYQREIWTKRSVKSLFNNVPDDRVLILDYANDYKAGWSHFNGFDGKSWIMGYIVNMGGKIAFTGLFNEFAKGASDMLKNPARKNNVGFTISAEGLENNQSIFELLSDTAWSREPINPKKWVEKYSRNRYGAGYPVEMSLAWDQLLHSCYGSFNDHPVFAWQLMKFGYGTADRSKEFFDAVFSFLSCNDHFKDSIRYQDDALELAAIALSLKVDEYFILANSSISSQKRSENEKLGLQLLLDIDRLLESHTLYKLDRWVDLARSHSTKKESQDFYEQNAKQILTIWGPPVNDYSCRLWSGLIRDFYQPRMKEIFKNRKNGNKFDRKEWEWNWVESKGISSIEAYENPILKAKELLNVHLKDKKILSDDKTVIGFWDSSIITREWTTIEIPIDTKSLKTLKSVGFNRIRGSSRLIINSVALIADGEHISSDSKLRFVGRKRGKVVYSLDVPKDISANNGAMLKVVAKGLFGVDTFGEIILIEDLISDF